MRTEMVTRIAPTIARKVSESQLENYNLGAGAELFLPKENTKSYATITEQIWTVRGGGS